MPAIGTSLLPDAAVFSFTVGDIVHSPLRYRAHIDGLRAIAVMGVVLFHFGAHWLPGGYIGVDVFFVISGFLISKSIYRDTGAGSFSIVDFYERRARRIAPAFIAVTLVTSAVAVLVLYPGQLKLYASSVVWSTLFAANIYFYRTSDYFAPAADELPLLHYWSLGVEEQFYIFFPLIVAACHRLRPKALPWLIGALLAASLVASEAVLGSNPAAAFYLLPFRAFELLIGAALALPGVRFPSGAGIGGAAVAAGGALILGAMAVLTEQSRFPGMAALMPCLGAALVIWGGEASASLPARAMSRAPLQFLGRISYSLYLVHWPIVVFVRMLMPDLDPRLFLIGGTAASIALGWLSFRFAEQPPRRNALGLFPRRAILGLTVGAMAVLLASAGTVIKAKGFPGRLAGDVQGILAYRSYAYQPVFREGTCFLRPEQAAAQLDASCLPTSRPSVVLWGSSHIAQFYGGLAPALAARGYALGQITGSACMAMIGQDNPQRPNCRGLNDFALDWLLANKPTIVVMGGDPIVNAGTLAKFDASVQKLVNAGIKVVVMGPVPYFKRPVPTILAERLQQESHDIRSGSELSDVSLKADALMTGYYKRSGSIKYISFMGKFCPDGQCRLGNEGAPLHFDTVHFTAQGSKYYGAQIADDIVEP